MSITSTSRFSRGNQVLSLSWKLTAYSTDSDQPSCLELQAPRGPQAHSHSQSELPYPSLRGQFKVVHQQNDELHVMDILVFREYSKSPVLTSICSKNHICLLAYNVNTVFPLFTTVFTVSKPEPSLWNAVNYAACSQGLSSAYHCI